MTTILVVGADTVVGGNLAARFSEDHRVATCHVGAKVTIGGCDALGDAAHPDRVVGRLQETPYLIVVAGSAARSSWAGPVEVDVEFARRWAETARDLGCGLTYVSTDAVFNGPRLFHEETDVPAANAIARSARLAEEALLVERPDALVVRTNAYGWSPTGRGWVESLLSSSPTTTHQHGTPIHARQLAELLDRAHADGLQGVWHAGGGERTNPWEFATRLRARFERTGEARRETRAVAMETSLSSTRLAATLDVALPMVDDGIARLLAESEDGYVDRLVRGECTTPVAA